jgi:hypothetical protein
MKHIVDLLWCVFCVAGSIYIWHWEHMSGWLVVLGIVLASSWRKTK